MISTLYEPFRHWSEKGSVYILSDLHFDDADCKFMSPDWITPQEQIAIINGMVMKNDTFICLGDVGSPEYIKDIKARKKILILGNHDAKGAYKNYFDEIVDIALYGEQPSVTINPVCPELTTKSCCGRLRRLPLRRLISSEWRRRRSARCSKACLATLHAA